LPICRRALAVLLVAAHALGALFARWRQPRVIGEIAAGLVLEPRLLGLAVFYGVHRCACGEAAAVVKLLRAGKRPI
jgi:Kef-type K+ transport system membrane component KefB